MSNALDFRRIADDVKRCILNFVEPGFGPLKRVNKWWLAFEQSDRRIQAAEAAVKERKSDMKGESNVTKKIAQRLPYVVSAKLVQWTHDEMRMPLDEIVCATAARMGYLGVLRSLRA